MSARDLARFALLYLNRAPGRASRSSRPTGCEKARVPTPTIRFRARLRLSVVDRAARRPEPGWLPEGTFFAWGAGGQHAFVIPAYDLVIVNRVDRDMRLPEPKLSEVKQLLGLTLKAGPFGR